MHLMAVVLVELVVESAGMHRNGSSVLLDDGGGGAGVLNKSICGRDSLV